MTNASAPHQKHLVPTFQTLELIDEKEIISVQAYENYSRLQLTNNRHITSTQSFGKYAELLESGHFYQSHKSHIVNIDHIVRYHKNGEIELTGGIKVPLARRRKDDFLTILQSSFYAMGDF